MAFKEKNKSIKEFKSAFERYVCSYKPFAWDTVKNDRRQSSSNNLLSSFIRYSKIMEEVFQKWEPGFSVVDFGVFPGVLPRLFKELFPTEKYKYLGIGLMFSPDFIREMQKINVELLETELDPDYFKPKEIKPILRSGADIVLFLDLVEHLANPIPALDSANQCLKKGGYLILTTDNITNSDNLMSMLRGKTPFLHPLQTNMFYMGDWRPHFREYAKDDLLWLIKNSGFTVVKHEYFNRKQGEFRVVNGCLRHNASFAADKGLERGTLKVFKRKLYKFIRSALSLIGSYRNHQLIVAVKTAEIEELEGKRPVLQLSLEGWHRIREENKIG